jgi:hypothetical protein
MSETSQKFKPVSTQRAPRKAVAAKIAGIIGVAICVLIIVVVWLGLGTVSRGVDGVGNSVNSGFDRAIAATDAVAGRFDEAVVAIDTMRADAAELVASRTADLPRLSNLQARLGQISDRYLEARVSYAEARETVVGVMSTLQQIAGIIPGTRVPEGAGDTLAAVDAKIKAIDDAIVSTGTTLANANPGQAMADALAARATPLKDAISGGATAVHGLSTNLTALQTKADSTIDSIRLVLLLAAIALSLLFVWVLALNIALWALGRAWERDSARA